jgi:hypothetical protein
LSSFFYSSRCLAITLTLFGGYFTTISWCLFLVIGDSVLCSCRFSSVLCSFGSPVVTLTYGCSCVCWPVDASFIATVGCSLPFNHLALGWQSCPRAWISYLMSTANPTRGHGFGQLISPAGGCGQELPLASTTHYPYSNQGPILSLFPT